MAKKKNNIKCHRCDHEWHTQSTSWKVTCSSCGIKVKNKKGGKKK